jgi:hypothetical protein
MSNHENTRRIVIGALLGIALGVASGGCAHSPLTEQASDTALNNDVAAIVSAPPRQRGPVTELLDSLWGTGLSPEEQARQLELETLRQEEVTAQCMRDAGFEYVPNPQANFISFSDPTLFRWDDRDWVAQWGYAAVSTPQPNPNNGELSAPEVVNPNWATMETLSEAELAAWQLAYWGIDDDNPGCMQLGSQAVDTVIGRRIEVFEEFRPLLESFGQLRNVVVEGPEFATIHRDWAYCMADAGYPGLEWQWEARSRLDEWIIEAGLQNESLGWLPRTPEINTMTSREISLALADFDCRISTEFQQRVDALDIAVETQFASDNQVAFNAFRSAIEQLDN